MTGHASIHASMVLQNHYVTHRDQLSPFRQELERLVISAWARNMRGVFDIGSPERFEEAGTDESEEEEES